MRQRNGGGADVNAGRHDWGSQYTRYGGSFTLRCKGDHHGALAHSASRIVGRPFVLSVNWEGEGWLRMQPSMQNCDHCLTSWRGASLAMDTLPQ